MTSSWKASQRRFQLMARLRTSGTGSGSTLRPTLRKTRVAYLNTALPLSLAIADTQEKELLWEGDPLEYQLLGHLEARQRVSVWASQPPEARRQEAQECGLSEVIKTNNHRRWEIADDQGRATLASKLGAGIDDVRGVFVTSQEIQEQKDNDFTAQLAALEADQQYAQALKLIGEQSEGLKQKLEAKAKTLEDLPKSRTNG